MTETLYVYYRVSADARERALAAAKNLIAAVARDTGCSAQLAHRSDDPDTWMEIYRDVADRGTLHASIAAHLVDACLLDCLQGGAARHEEWFRFF